MGWAGGATAGGGGGKGDGVKDNGLLLINPMEWF